MDHSKTFTGLFFARLPQFNGLEAFEATKEGEDGEHVFSPIQPSCWRELIFTEERILLSPRLEQKNLIVVILQKEVKKSRGFLDLLGRLNIRILRDVDVTKSLFQYCLAFTLNQKLAPLWNKVGEFYVQGRDFLTELGKLNAVRIEVNVTDKISLAIEALNVKLIASKPEHFCSAGNTMARFNSDPLYHIQSLSVEDNLCYVLPSFKSGSVIGISRKLPTDGIFSDYEALRKHWKVLYGWRLPIAESVFYKVEFCNLPDRKFTYPASCVRSSEPIVTYRCDQQEIFSSFVQDLQHRMPNICGIPLRFTTAPLYPLDKLYSGSCGKQSNLTRAAPQLKSCRQFEIKLQTKTAAFAGGVQPTGRNNSTESQDTFQRISATASNLTVTKRMASGAESVATRSTLKQSRIIPTFTSFKSKMFGTGKHSNKKGKLKSIDAPSSHTTLPAVGSGSSKRKETPNEVEKNKKLHSCSLAEKEDGTYVKRHKSLKKRLHSRVTVVNESKSVRPNYSLHTSVGDSQNAICESNEVQQSPLQGEKQSEPVLHTECVTGEKSRKIPDEPSFIATKATPVAQKERNMLNKSVRKPAGVEEALNSSRNPVVETTNALNKASSSQIHSDSDELLKNPRRSKPRVQKDIDVRECALNNKLNKVNAMTLSSWLKEHGIVVRSKDKKTDLVEKVVQYVGAQKHEL